jgi:hypothetical protein
LTFLLPRKCAANGDNDGAEGEFEAEFCSPDDEAEAGETGAFAPSSARPKGRDDEDDEDLKEKEACFAVAGEGAGEDDGRSGAGQNLSNACLFAFSGERALLTQSFPTKPELRVGAPGTTGRDGPEESDGPFA